MQIDEMMDKKIDKYTILNQYFGYSQFREGQEELIDAFCQEMMHLE